MSRAAAARASGGFWTTVASASLVGPALAAIVIGRLSGAAAFGWFAAGWAVADLVSRLASFGFERGLPIWLARHEAAGDHASSRRVLRMALFMALPASVIATLVGGTLVRQLGPFAGASPALLSAVATTLFAVPGLVVYRVSTALSLAKHAGGHAIVSRLGGAMAAVLSILLASSSRMAMLGPGLAAIAGALVSGLLAFVCARRVYAAVPRTPVADGETSALFACSLPGGVDNLLSAGTRQVGLIVLAMTGGSADAAPSLGAYGMALAIAGVLTVVPRAVQPACDDAIEASKSGQEGGGEALFTSAVRWTFGLLMLGAGLLMFSGPSILRLAGLASTAAAPSLAVLVAAFVLIGLAAPARLALIRARPGVGVFVAAAGCVVAVSLAAVFVPLTGAPGAAWSVLVATAAGAVLAHLGLRASLGWRWDVRRLLAPAVAAAFAAALTVAALAVAGQQPLGGGCPGWAGVLFVGVFAAACWPIHLDRSDRAVLDRLVRRSRPLTHVPA